MHLFSSNCKSNSVLTKPETKQVDVSKSTFSSLKFSKPKPKTFQSSSKNKKFSKTSLISGDSSWKPDTYSILNTVKQRNYSKLSSGKKLENIFKIYNRKDMVTKLNSLRRISQKENLRKPHFHSIENENHSYKDNNYNSPVYLSKFATGHKKFNTSLYSSRLKSNSLIPEMAEGETSQEATPNSSTLKLRMNVEVKEGQKMIRTSINNFNGTIRYNSEEKKPFKYREKSKPIKSRRTLNTYLKKNQVIHNF